VGRTGSIFPLVGQSSLSVGRVHIRVCDVPFGVLCSRHGRGRGKAAGCPNDDVSPFTPLGFRGWWPVRRLLRTTLAVVFPKLPRSRSREARSSPSSSTERLGDRAGFFFGVLATSTPISLCHAKRHCDLSGIHNVSSKDETGCKI